MNRQDMRRYLQMTPKQAAANSSRIALDIQRGRALRAMENEALAYALQTKAGLLDAASEFAKYGTATLRRQLDCAADAHADALDRLSAARNAQ